MKSLKNMLLSKRGQLSMEFALLMASVSLIGIVTAYYYIYYTQKSNGINNSGKKANKFINITNNKSGTYIDAMNNLSV